MPPATALLLAALAATAEPAGSAPEPAPSPAAAPAPAPAPAPPPAAAPDAASDGRAPKRAPRPRAVAPPRASRPTVEGALVAVDHRAHRLTLRTATGEVTLSFDRNTFVFAAGGASSLVGAAPGQAVRAGHDGAHRATWVELKGSTPPSTPASAP